MTFLLDSDRRNIYVQEKDSFLEAEKEVNQSYVTLRDLGEIRRRSLPEHTMHPPF